ncbi:MAG: YkvA family protein [Heyndrickxia sp.]
MFFKKLLGKVAYKLFYKEAKKYLGDKKETDILLSRTERKALNNKLSLGNVWRKLSLLIQLLKSWVTGEYKDVPYKTIIMLTVGLLYFVSPIDIIPDFLIGFGFVDDAAVIALIFSQIDKDLIKYLEWKKEQRP